MAREREDRRPRGYTLIDLTPLVSPSPDDERGRRGALLVGAGLALRVVCVVE